jgi:hypothetical protein
MKSLSAFLIAILISVPGMAKSTFEPFPLKTYSDMKPCESEGLQEAHCITTEDGYSVTKGYEKHDGKWDKTASAIVVVKKGDQALAAFNDQIVGTPASNGFEVLEGDLKGDGSKDMVIADYDGSGNGLGVCYWDLHVLSLPEGKPLTSTTDEDYGKGSFIKLPNEKACCLLKTSWEESDGKTYFVGRVQPIIKAIPATLKKATFKRRLTYKFQDERNGLGEGEALPIGEPLKWLRLE